MTEYLFPTKVVSGWGCLSETGSHAKILGRKALVITGKTMASQQGFLPKLLQSLNEAGIVPVLFSEVEPEPSLETVDQAVELGKKEKCDFVIGLGGGSALDTAKSVAGLMKLTGSVREFLYNQEIKAKGVPFVAIPTTAGSGSEATKNSVLSDKQKGIKISLRSPYLMADLVILDPSLTVSMPPELTALSGMDCLTHACEALVCNTATPLTESLALTSLKMTGENLLEAFQHGENEQARDAMLLASFVAGMSFSNSGLGTVHGLAHPVGARYHISHGLVCALLLPAVMEFNLAVAEAQYAKMAYRMRVGEIGADAIKAVKKLLQDLKMPRGLACLGVKKEDIPQLLADTQYSGSLKYNPRQASKEELSSILEKAL